VVLHSIHFEIVKLSVGNSKVSNANVEVEYNDNEEFTLEQDRSVEGEELINDAVSKGKVEECADVSRRCVEIDDSNSEEFNESEESIGCFVELINDALDCGLVITGIF
jgi:hypothetical protein